MESYEQVRVKTGWSVAGSLFTENSDITVSLQQVFTEVSTYTVQIAVRGETPGRATALIAWNVDGNEILRRVDVCQGVSISGVAGAVRVVVSDATNTGDSPAPSTEYTVGITVAKGVRAGPSIPTLLAEEGTVAIAAGASATWSVPLTSGITAFQVHLNAAPPVAPIYGDVSFSQLTYGAAGVLQGAVRPFQWIPLGNGTYTITIANDTTLPAAATIIYGIDG